MAKKNKIALSGSVQSKNGHLYLVYAHFDPMRKEKKPKWKSMGLDVGEKKSVIEKRKRELLTELEEKENRLQQGYNDPDCYPMVEFINEWLDQVHIHKIQPFTHQGYKNMLNGKIARFFGKKFTLGDIRKSTIEDFYNKLRADGDSERTILHYSAFLYTACEYAVRREIFDFNPMTRVERPKPEKFTGGFYKEDEVRLLIQLAEGDPIYIPVVLASYYGLRRSEAIGLAWDSVDFEEKIIYIRRKAMGIAENGKTKVLISEEMKTESSMRTLPLIPEVEEILLRHKAKQEENRRMFRSGYSKKYLNMVCVNAVGEILKPDFVTAHFSYLLKKYGLRKIRFHDLRHTCASLLLSKSVNMKVIQMWMGHSSMKTTFDIYAHLDVNAKEEAARILEKVLRLNENESED